MWIMDSFKQQCLKIDPETQNTIVANNIQILGA